MFEDTAPRRDRQRRKEATVDEIRTRFGKGAIVKGTVLDSSELGIFDPKTHTED